jgi:hypothetical protein
MQPSATARLAGAVVRLLLAVVRGCLFVQHFGKRGGMMDECMPLVATPRQS